MLKPFLDSLLNPAMVRLYVLVGSLAVIVAILKSPWFKGWAGELMVKLIAKLRLNPRDYAMVHNVTLPTENGTTQIDHVIVSRFGIFVVETKNMKGMIIGRENEPKWTQKLGRNSYSFQNPLRQNYKHTETLADCLGLPRSIIHSVVVFVGNSKFGKDMPENVTYCTGYVRYMLKFTEEVLTAEDMQSVLELIRENRLQPGLRTHINHVRHVKEIKAGKEKATLRSEKKATVPATAEAPDEPESTGRAATSMAATAAAPTCPQCGSVMVLRTARKGANAGQQFWGCSQYPKCRKMMPCS